jgi:hypothetical protein
VKSSIKKNYSIFTFLFLLIFFIFLTVFFAQMKNIKRFNEKDFPQTLPTEKNNFFKNDFLDKTLLFFQKIDVEFKIREREI